MMRSLSSPTSSKGIAAIVGVGSNLGRSIARKFAQEGYTVAILARDLEKLSRFADEIAREAKAQVFAIRIDCSNSKSVCEAFEGVLSLGFVEVLVYNACEPSSPHPPTRFADITLESFEKSMAVSAVGAFHCAQRVIPGMVERGKGTIIFTGSLASLTGFAGYYELSKLFDFVLHNVPYNFRGWALVTEFDSCRYIGCGKFALRGLSQCLAREFQGLGIHIAHVVVDGTIGTSRSSSSTGDESKDDSMDPDAIAHAYWQIHTQDKGAWSQEIDLRSFDRRF